MKVIFDRIMVLVLDPFKHSSKLHRRILCSSPTTT